jgi:hypothetical protein
MVQNCDGSVQLLIENLKSFNNPDVKVNQTNAAQSISFLNLEALKSINGNQFFFFRYMRYK